MDIYQATVDYLLTRPIFDSWQDLRIILQRTASTRPRDWQLPVIACEAVGGPEKTAIPACAALACALISILLVDDMLDNDPRGEYRQIGHGRASNLAIAFQSAAMDALIASGVSSLVRQKALFSLNRMMLTTAFGQELDVQNPSDEPSYWRMVENKSGPFFGCALHLGSLFAEAREDVSQNLEHLGRVYGELIQIHDDLNDSMAVPANPDWLQKRKPLPILFVLTVEHPDRSLFMELYEDISTGEALQEAQEILIRCGAVSYCVDQLIRRHRIVRKILKETPLADQEIVHSLLEGVISPVWRLFESLGLSPHLLTETSAPNWE